MNTNKQKIILCTFGFVAAFVALMVVLPFNVLFERININFDNIKGIELIFKFIIFPLIIIFMSVFVLKLRNSNLNNNYVKTSLLKMAYVPITMYISGLLAWIGGVVYALEVHIANSYALLTIIVVWSISFIIVVLFGIYTKWLHHLSYEQIKVIDIVYFIITFIIMVLCFAIYYNINDVKVENEADVFIKISIYIIMYFVILLFVWKDIYSEKQIYIISSKHNDETIIYKEAIKNVNIDFNNYNLANLKEEKEDEEAK